MITTMLNMVGSLELVGTGRASRSRGAQHYTILYYTTLYCTVLYDTIL